MIKVRTISRKTHEVTLTTFYFLSSRLLFYHSNPWRIMGHPDHWEEEVGRRSWWVFPLLLLLTIITHIVSHNLLYDFTHTQNNGNNLNLMEKMQDFAISSMFCTSQFPISVVPQLWPTRRETFSLMVPTRWTVRRTSTQQARSSSTAGPWMCTRPGSSTLSPKARSTRPSIFWYTFLHPPLWLELFLHTHLLLLHRGALCPRETCCACCVVIHVVTTAAHQHVTSLIPVCSGFT